MFILSYLCYMTTQQLTVWFSYPYTFLCIRMNPCQRLETWQECDRMLFHHSPFQLSSSHLHSYPDTDGLYSAADSNHSSNHYHYHTPSSHMYHSGDQSQCCTMDIGVLCYGGPYSHSCSTDLKRIFCAVTRIDNDNTCV